MARWPPSAPASTRAAARDPHRILELTRELCAYPAAVVGEADEALFARIAGEVPLRVHRYPSGAEHLGWRVPELSRVRRARILRDGEVVLDGAEHPLVVAMGSLPFTGELDLEELRPHLVTDPARPDAYVFHCQWQYRPWQADWALSIPYARYRELLPGAYRVELEVDREPGEMLVGVAHHAGDDPRTIVFNSHTCHPGQANDGMSRRRHAHPAVPAPARAPDALELPAGVRPGAPGHRLPPRRDAPRRSASCCWAVCSWR